MNSLVEFLGTQRNITGTPEMDIPITEYPLVRDALDYIVSLYPDLNLSGESTIITVNGEVTSPDRELRDGDTVMFLPAIGGG